MPGPQDQTHSRDPKRRFYGPRDLRLSGGARREVIADARLLRSPEAAREGRERGAIDALVVNLALPAPPTRLADVDEAEWREAFEVMVDPLPRLVRAAIPGMKQRGGGRIVVMGSASALRGMKRASTYSAARGAQLAYVQAAGVELAPDNIQINAIAQHFVDNPTYFRPRSRPIPVFTKG